MNLPTPVYLLPLMLIALQVRAEAYEIGFRYYRITDSAVANALDEIDDRYDEKEEPLKEIRRSSGYNTPEHAEATKRLDALREQRDREFLRVLENTPPLIDYSTPAEPGDKIEDSTRVNGKTFDIELQLLQKDGNKIPVEINAIYDGDKLYQGSALLIPIATPYVVTKAFVKIQDNRQGSMLFVEVRP